MSILRVFAETPWEGAGLPEAMVFLADAGRVFMVAA
jgi:hypothetical protein